MDHLSRKATLNALRAMGIDIPGDTPLPDDALDKRLRTALNAAQSKDRLLPRHDLKSLPEWPRPTPDLARRRRILCFPFTAPGAKPEPIIPDPTSLAAAILRSNFHESRVYLSTLKAKGEELEKLYQNPFMNMRDLVRQLVNFVDSGSGWCLVDGNSKTEAVNIRVISVRTIHAMSPAFILLYRIYTREARDEAMEWALREATECPLDPHSGLRSLNHLVGDADARNLFLKLLKMNSALVPDDFPVYRKPDEEDFQVSLFLPIGPLEQDVLAKLNERVECAVCGKSNSMFCTRCQAIRYCGKDCQRADWTKHKQNCVPIAGGRWCAVRTTDDYLYAMPEMREVHAKQPYVQPTTINTHCNRVPDGRKKPMFHDMGSLGSRVPPNVWGTHPFLVKFQVELGTDEPMHLMMYDRKRSFQVFFVQQDDPTLFAEFLAEVRRPRGGHEGLKMYRWARRTGDWTFNVCLDRAPTTGTQW